MIQHGPTRLPHFLSGMQTKWQLNHALSALNTPGEILLPCGRAPYAYNFAHRVRAFHGDIDSQIIMDMRASLEAARGGHAERAERQYYGYSDDDDDDWLFGYPADRCSESAKRPQFLLIADADDYLCDDPVYDDREESDIDGYDSCPDFIEYHTSKCTELLPCRRDRAWFCPRSCPDDWLSESMEVGP